VRSNRPHQKLRFPLHFKIHFCAVEGSGIVKERQNHGKQSNRAVGDREQMTEAYSLIVYSLTAYLVVFRIFVIIQLAVACCAIQHYAEKLCA
jgi:hypothetical protein